MRFEKDFWESIESQVLLNPKLNSNELENLIAAAKKNQKAGTVWLKSSGTESELKGHKLVSLSKKAILCAARSYNIFFQVTSEDRFLNPLPTFHIGGLSIYARAFLAKAYVDEFSNWNAERFRDALGEKQTTITSLVPTQVFDLVEANLRGPKSLRFVLVGGGVLGEALYLKARRLGWPLVPSYGMTETGAVMAAANLESLKKEEFPHAYVLPHITFIEESFNKYSVRSESLFDGFLWVTMESSRWEKRPNPFILDDRLAIEGDRIQVFGRDSELIKILGESVNLQELTERLRKLIHVGFAVVPVAESRKGFDLHLFVEHGENVPTLENLNSRLLPFEKFSQIHRLKELPRNELGKVKISSLKSSLC